MRPDDARTHTINLREPSLERERRYLEISSPGRPSVLRVREGVVRVGREPGNDIVIDDSFVSRTHVEIRVGPQGVTVTDLDTKNGTHFQGARIRTLTVQGEATLLLGKQISLRMRLGDETRPVIVDESRLVGASPATLRLRETLARVGPTMLNVLIDGETGTGKEVVAQAIHSASERARKNFVVFDCASVAPNLVASELFGHARGAYTGAHVATEGAFRRAQHGTLFLDEIGELPLDLQPALLRAIEAHQVKPVGGDAYIPVDVRLVAATNRLLEQEVEKGTFRKDLLFRLAVARIRLTPLRTRIEDIGLLAQHFARRLGSSLAPNVVAQLERRQWVGNVRELRNVVEAAVMLTGIGSVVTVLENLGGASESLATLETPSSRTTLAPPPADGLSFQDAKQVVVDTFEKDYLVKLFAEANYNLSEAARRSGVDRRYLRELFKKHDLDPAAMRTRGRAR